MLKIKTGDKVIIISGKNKGKYGVIKKVFKKKYKAIVSGLNINKKHIKPNNQKPTGRILEIESPIHISNLSFIDPINNKKTKIGFSFQEKKKIRVFKKSGSLLNDNITFIKKIK